ncbi:MAG: mannose-1-phosphate guanylyltransferase [Polyangiales bacterium]
MAGGSGTRFWPLSRKSRPKQLLPLGPTPDSLLAATVRRIAPLVPPERVLVVTSAALADAIAEDLPEVPRANILAEPMGRNTAPCVGWAAAVVARRDPRGVMMVLPADHHIGDVPSFLDVLERSVAAARGGGLVTVGIRPTRPETGYGYLEVGDEIASGVHRAVRFVEKPVRAKAEEFLAGGRHLWNSGMFFFRADVVRAAIASCLPEVSSLLDRYDAAAREGTEARTIAATYGDMPNVSIDHGVMEKAPNVLVVPGSFAWSDLGSFTTAWELSPKDDAQNAVPEGSVVVQSKGCYVSAPRQKLVALVGVEDLVVVDTEDALLVMPRQRDQDVREVVEALKQRNDPRL